jgi:hypothetical protein
MRAILSERNLVVVLFVLVFISFALAHEDSKKMEKAYTGFNQHSAPRLASLPQAQISILPE